MAATLFTANITTDRLIAIKSQRSGEVISQFGGDAISVTRLLDGVHLSWVISRVDDNGNPLNVVYVRQGDAAQTEKAWVVEYRTGDDSTERLAFGAVVELGDFGSLDAALSAALLLAVGLYR